MNLKEDKTELDKIEITILTAVVLVILFSFFAPIIFTNSYFTIIDLSDKGEVGDAVGGLMNPFIAIAGVLITFLAFYIQFKANKLQRKLFKDELETQQTQIQDNKFENQFYEMLRLHKENVNEISLNFRKEEYIGKVPFVDNSHVNGREVFKHLVEEIKVLYYVAKHIYGDKSPESNLRKAYEIFFHGFNSFKRSKTAVGEDLLFETYLMALGRIKNSMSQNKLIYLDYVPKEIELINHDILGYDIFEGYSSSLAHYYRHLFQTVKFVVKGNPNLSYEQIRNYLRILRAQLSNQEQVMLFYNWKSKFGYNWEFDKNKFFTDYRMIHNIYGDIIIKDFILEEIFRLEEDVYYKTEHNRDWDPLFEFQDWERVKQ